MAKKKTTTRKYPPAYPVVTGTVTKPRAPEADLIGVNVNMELRMSKESRFTLIADWDDNTFSLHAGSAYASAIGLYANELRPLAQALLQAADMIDAARGVMVGSLNEGSP